MLADGVSAQVSFKECGIDTGLIHSTGYSHYACNNWHGLGTNWIDYDSDGDPDLFIVNGLKRNAHLFRNNGDGSFTPVDQLLPTLPGYEQMGSVFADYDRDGDPDIYIFTDHEVKDFKGEIHNPSDGPPNLLLKNLWVESGGKAEPMFQETAAAAGVDDLADPPLGAYTGYRSATGGFLDYDRDGWIDLYVAHWVCSAGGELSNLDRLYRNMGDGTFQDVTSLCGLHTAGQTGHLRPALAFLGAHLDDDDWPDIYLGNVQDVPPYGYDIIYKNDAGLFTDVTLSSPGVGDDSGAAMGITIGDIELDGDWDIYISDLLDNSNDSPPHGNPLYLGLPDGTMSDNAAVAAGVQADNSWGVNFMDINLDGYEDLYVGAMLSAVEPAYLYMNQQDGTFVDVAAGSGLDLEGNVRGSAYADYDGDGDLDLAVAYQADRVYLFRNDTASKNHWLKIKLTGVRSNLDAIGAVVHVVAGDLQMMRQVIAGDSGHGQNAFDLHFGLADNSVVDRIEVRWPCGGRNVYENVAADQHLQITETFGPDLDADGMVSVTDLLALLSAWGQCSDCPGCLEDFDGNGVVNTVDLLQLLANWGRGI
jgi:hypothetical protein